MRPTLPAALLTLLAAAPTLAQAQDASEPDRRFTAERVFDIEYADGPAVSPDGGAVLYVRRSMDRLADRVESDLWRIDVATGAHRPLIAGPGSVSSPVFSPSGDRFLTMTSADGRPVLRVHYTDTNDGFAIAQLPEAPSAPVWSPDGRTVAFTMQVREDAEPLATPPAAPEGADWAEPVRLIDRVTFRFDGVGYLKRGDTHVFTVPAEGGTPRQVTDGDGGFAAPAWLSNDRLVVVGNPNEDRDLDPIESDLFAVDLGTLERTRLTTRDGPDASPKASPDGRMIAYAGYDDEQVSYQQTDLYVMRADGGGPRNLTSGYDRSIGAFTWHPDGNSILALAATDGETSLLRVPLAGSGAPEVIASDVGGTSIGRPYGSGAFSVGGTARRPVIAWTSAAPDRPADIAVMAGRSEPRLMTALNEDTLAYLDLAEIEEIEVASTADGLPIEAWVALPPGFERDGSRPLILEIHGGPFAMYGPTFSAEVQRYAAEGYVVAYVNPRGSTGYGEDFARQIDLAYPGRDYDDLMSVVSRLVDDGYVDPERLFVTGGSGGGVLTAWIVGTTDRFQAAATIKPVINWTTMALAADIGPYVARHWMQADPWEAQERYWSLSPLSRAGNVTTPTLVMVGEEDWRTPAWEAEQFYTALKLQDVPTALVRVPGTSHSIAARPSNLIAKVDNILGWFARYDPASGDQQEGDAEDEGDKADGQR